MSDGPDKTLGMPRRWRAFAKAAATDAFESTEVRDLLETALEESWRREVSPVLLKALRKEFGDSRQGSLFRDQRLPRLEALRKHAAGSPLGNTTINCAVEVAAEGLDGPAAWREVIKRALLERAQSGTYQVETHYRYEATETDSVNVRRRSAAAVQATDFAGLAARLAGDEPKPLDHRIRKQTGIEEGPPL
jgi:hypothetical protein